MLTSVTFPIILKLLEPYCNAFGSAVKNLPATQETWVQFLSQEDPLKEEMATHSSILAWEIPWTGGVQEPGGVQSIGSQSQTQLTD